MKNLLAHLSAFGRTIKMYLASMITCSRKGGTYYSGMEEEDYFI